MMRSLREFSKLAGVSPSTVSRVFSGTGRVSPETQKRILQLAESLDFRPSAIGQVAFGGGTQSVGVLVPSLAVSFFADIVRGLQKHMLKTDHLPIVLEAETGIFDQRAVQRLLDHRVDAMLLTLMSESLTPDDLGSILRSQIPVVILGSFRASLGLDAVDNDDLAGGRAVAEHLLGLGHRDFGFVYFGEGHTNSDQRLNGFREALAEAGVALPTENIVSLDPHRADRERLLGDDLLKLLSRPDRPTAVFASTDDLARAVYSTARGLGLSIPHDLSVVGYANLNFSGLISPPLTTVDQNGLEIGHRAAQLILDRLGSPQAPYRTEIVPVRLVVRESTARPPKTRQPTGEVPAAPTPKRRSARGTPAL